MDIVIGILIVLGIILLGRYAIVEGQRVESQKEFEKNLHNWDKKYKNEKK